MTAFPNNDRMKAFANQARDSSMSDVDQRTSGFDDIQAPAANVLHSFLRCAMCGNHNRFGLHISGVLRDFDSPSLQAFEHPLVMDEVSKDGQRLGLGLSQGKINGVAHAEAHAQMFCTNYFHMLCITK